MSRLGKLMASMALVVVGVLPGGADEDVVATRLRIPEIGVHAEVLDLGLRDDGSLETPDDDFDQAGWWTGGAAPGEAGAAVVVGHVDSTRGPAVFFRLRELEAGDAVEFVRDDGTSDAYVVTRIERVAKDEFPTERVYGPTAGSELRLITCGGEFDRGARSYRDNVIVWAELRV